VGNDGNKPLTEVKMAQKRITRKAVEKYLEKNAPHLGAYEHIGKGDKGVYRKDAGPAQSFRAKGKTWADVMAAILFERDGAR
jgi:hypothetical protein